MGRMCVNAYIDWSCHTSFVFVSANFHQHQLLHRSSLLVSSIRSNTCDQSSTTHRVSLLRSYGSSPMSSLSLSLGTPTTPSQHTLYATALQEIAPDYPWIANATTSAELATHLRTCLQFRDEMMKLVTANCTLQTGLPRVEEDLRNHVRDHCTQLETLTHAAFQTHRETVDNEWRHIQSQWRAQCDADQQQQQTYNAHEQERSTQSRLELSNLAEQLTAMTNHLQEATSEWKSTMSNGSRKGALGEREVMEALQLHFHTMSVVHTGGTQESGDIHLLHTDQDGELGDVLVEVKCYANLAHTTTTTKATKATKIVPQHEVDKFEHDVDRCQMPLAVMGALGTGIRSKGRMQVVQRNGTLVMYLPNTTPGGIVTGILALQLLHKWRPSTNTIAPTEAPADAPSHSPTSASPTPSHPSNTSITSTSSPTSDVTLSYNHLLQQLHPLMQHIEQELEHNTFFSDMMKELNEMDHIRRRMKLRVEEHKTRLAEVSRRARRLLQHELNDAALLTQDPTQASTPPATTPDARRSLVERVLMTHGQTESTRNKQHIALAAVLTVFEHGRMGLRECDGGMIVLAADGESLALMEVKKTKVVLRDLGKTWSVHLTNDTGTRLEKVVRGLLMG